MGRADDILERIEAEPQRVVLVRGPAASGKTSAVLSLYERSTGDDGRPACLILCPNAPAVQGVRRRLLERSAGGVLISPEVSTFAALAVRILTADGQPANLLSPLRRQLLLREILDDLDADGRLGGFRAVLDTPGLTVALDRSIAELKRAAAEPDDLAAALGARPGKRRDLLEVYRAYQQRLREAGEYDVEGQMWQARDTLAEGKAATGLDGVRILAADGFTDFTPTQLDILSRLAGRVDRVVITLPHADDGRERMWRWTARTLHRLRSHFGGELAEILLDADAADEVGPAVGRKLFAGFAGQTGASEPPDGLSIIAAAGIEAEVAAAARHVKRLFADGAAGGSVAVLARSLTTCEPTVRRVFAEHGLSVSESPRPLTESPVVRFVLRTAAIPHGGYAFADVLRCVKSSYFRPAALGDFTDADVAAAEALIRDGNVLEGREAYARAAERLTDRAVNLAARRADEADDDGESEARLPEVEPIRRAAAMLEALFDVLGGAEDASGPPAAVVTDALDLRAAVETGDDAHRVARDLRALEALGAALDELGDAGVPPARLARVLEAVPVPPARGEAMVHLLDVLDARAMRYPHVVLLGVNEGEFPARFSEGPLLGEDDRRGLAERGVPLDLRSDLTAREMLLFYLAVTRAGRSLAIAYRTADEGGVERLPSGFLTALAAPFGGLDGDAPAAVTTRIDAGDLVPDASEPTSPRSALLSALGGTFADLGDPRALGWLAAEAPDDLRRAARGLFAWHRRWRPGECDAFDGRIDDADLLARLADRFPGGQAFSASQLNAYGQCPWRYFARYVLDLAPLEPPQRRLEPQDRGTFCHDVLRGVMARLGEAFGLPLQLDDVPADAVADALDAEIAAAARRVEARRPPYPALWEIQKEQMRRALREYLDRCRAECDPPAAFAHFELAFGEAPRPDEPVDPASRAEPVTLDCDAGTVRLRGRIDRVDRVERDGVEMLRVVDYKTGRLPSRTDVTAGRNLQLPLYALAARRILGGPCVGGEFHRVAIGESRRRMPFAAYRLRAGRTSDDGAYEDDRERAESRIGEFVAAMAAGRFDALPTHDCPGWCPFRQACEYSPARAEVKSPPEPAGEDGS